MEINLGLLPVKELKGCATGLGYVFISFVIYLNCKFRILSIIIPSNITQDIILSIIPVKEGTTVYR